MENNKYYTPEIEEFCVGFECEFKSYSNNQEQWDKRIIGVGSFSPESYEDITCKSNWRVKYLDNTDIESFGFINIPTTGTQRFKKYVNLKQFEDGEWFDYYLLLSLRYFDNTPYITIKKIDIHTYEEEVEVSDNVRSEYLFQGHVRNKHEFKKLLNQLGIYGNTNNK